MKVPRILVCGGRNYSDMKTVFNTLYDLCEEGGFVTESDELGNYLPVAVIIHGDASGADSLANDWAMANWCKIESYPADWNKYGKAAGPIRNRQMLEEGKPDIVVAFPGGRGTANMIKLARDAGVPVKIVDAEHSTTK